MSLFNELKASLEEAVAIQQERQPAARVTRYEVADVKAIRAALNVSQQEVADALGVSRQAAHKKYAKKIDQSIPVPRRNR